MSDAPLRSVAIVGGGVSGALTAVHLARRAPGKLRVTLFERASREARGIAYGTAEPGHLLNVRASNMSAFPDEPGHFESWLKQQPGADAEIFRTPAGDFVPRALYGQYLFEVLQRGCQEDGGGCIEVRRADIVGVERAGKGFSLRTAGGGFARADHVVLAMGNIAEGVAAPGPIFVNPWALDAVRDLDPARPILIQGTGLTMIDTVIALRRNGFAGPILALSRRGLLPQPHVPAPPIAPMNAGDVAGSGILHLTREVKKAARRAMAAGDDWRPVVDALRPVTQTLWRTLPHRDKARFLRHARPFWDAHRHRIAPPVAALLERELREGGLTILTGRIQSTDVTANGVSVRYARRGAGEQVTLDAQRLIVATGIAKLSDTGDTLIGRLISGGLVRLDSLGLGIDVDDRLAVRGAQGEPVADLWALGPIVRGVFWECTAVPDIRIQAAQLAELIGNS